MSESVHSARVAEHATGLQSVDTLHSKYRSQIVYDAQAAEPACTECTACTLLYSGPFTEFRSFSACILTQSRRRCARCVERPRTCKATPTTYSGTDPASQIVHDQTGQALNQNNGQAVYWNNGQAMYQNNRPSDASAQPALS